MNMSELKACADEFVNCCSKPVEIALEFSKPWHFNHSFREEHPPFRGSPGVYIYAEPSLPSWQMPFEKCTSAVWYIGMSNGDIAGRVWRHVEPIYDPATNQPWTPRFKQHQWWQNTTIPSHILEAVATGNVVVYGMKVEPVGPLPGLPRVLEAYLLARYYAATGSLPLLNADL